MVTSEPKARPNSVREGIVFEQFSHAIRAPNHEPLEHYQSKASTVASGTSILGLRSEHSSLEGADGGLFEDSYEVLRRLGGGANGEVFLVSSKKTGTHCAAKKFPIADRAMFEQELGILKLLRHPNLVLLSGAFVSCDDCFLVMEACSGGDLLSFVRARQASGAFGVALYEGPPSHVVALFSWQILKGIAYLHSNRIVHRDVKTENFLLATKCPPQRATIKLADFGESSRWEGTECRLTELVGTMGYVAPEVLKENGYNEKCDIWSAGCVCYLLFCGRLPMNVEEDASINEALSVKENTVIDYNSGSWSSHPKRARDHIKRMLVKEPELRSCAAEVLHDPWMLSCMEEGGGQPQCCSCAVS